MLTKGAIEDLIARYLSRGKTGSGTPVYKKVPELGKKLFLSDFELRKMVVPGSGVLTVAANAIISPLALDWLDYDGVKITRAGK